MRLTVKLLLSACLAAGVVGSAHAAETVYSNAFDPPQASPEWTVSGNTFGFEQDANSGSWFLGRFFGDISDLLSGQGTIDNRTDATLSLSGLPPHRTVTVAFDLLVLGSWDGNNVYAQWGGPDRFLLDVVDGPSLVSTTFANCWPATQTQAYPDDVPAEHPAATGAVAVNAVGVSAYTCDGGYHDAVYRVVRTFDHVGADLALRFSGVGLQWWFDESWALDNVVVSVEGAPVSWSGVQQPIDADGTSVFKAGSTVPVKFFLTDADAGVTDLVAKLSYTRLGASTHEVNEAASTSAATVGNLFRFDADAGQYVFNWGTVGLEPGKYALYVDLGDGVRHEAVVSLR
jgi:hypothetical protein